ncbi:hypothetical protein JCM16303_007439 [Sporobolomyces ruberrimus]
MLLDSIRERKHAARTEDEEPVVDEQTATIEELGKEGGKKEENKKEGGENALASMIKHLYLEASGQVGMARGGGKVFIELIERCRKVEGLEIKPMFPRSATKPLLKALNNLPFLEALDIQSSTSDEYPFLVTTPRIFEIQKSSPNLNALTVQYLKSGYEADEDEDAEMWDQADREEDLERLEAEEEENEADDRPSEMHKTDRKVDRVKQKGLKALSLFDFDVSSEEIAIILRHSKKTIVELALQRPGTSFGRYDAALVFLRFGHTLTHVNLALPSTWSPKPALTQPFKPNPPMKPKGYVTGQPSHELLTKVAAYHYILDAILPFLPNLKNLGWNGPIASSYAFALMPPSLKTVSWGHCTSVEPRILARLLNKTTTRNTTFTRADGSKGTRSVKTKIAKGLQCASVNHDDMSWNDEEIRLLDSAMKDRGCCFHLSSEGAAGLFGGLGGLGGLAAGMGMGGGVGAMGIPIPIPLGMGVGGFGRH